MIENSCNKKFNPISEKRKYTLKVEGFGSFQVEEDKKLVIALEENGIDVSHRCGGNARCTTCNVQFLSPEPPMENKEYICLFGDEVLNQFRLSCQIRIHQDMHIKVLTPASEKGWDPGPPVEL